MTALRQTTADGDGTRSPAARPRGLWGAVALALVGAAGAALVAVADARSARRADESRTELAAAAVRSEVERLIGSMRGASGLAADGSVTEAEFMSYAADILRYERFQAVALVDEVTRADRAAFEAAWGAPVRERTASGTDVTAPDRDAHWVLRYSAPAGNPGQALVGSDVGRDPARQEAYARAASTGSAALSAPLTGLATGERSYLLVVPIIGGEGEVSASFSISTVRLTELIGNVRGRLPAGTRVAIADGDVALTQLPPDEGAIPVAVGGRGLRVSGDDGRSTSLLGPIGLFAGAQLAALGLVALARRDEAARRREAGLMERLSRDRERSANLALLARAVAVARTPTEVAAAAASHARHVLGGTLSSVGLLDGSPPGLTVVHDPGVAGAAGARSDRQSLDAALPYPEAVRTGDTVVCADPAALAAAFPAAAADLRTAGLLAIAAVPLVGPDGPLGVLGVAWDRPVEDDDALRSLLSTAAGVCAQALSRAQLSERRERGARRLAVLTQALAAASGRAAVAEALAGHPTALLDADTVVFTGVTPDDRAAGSDRDFVALAAEIHGSLGRAGSGPRRAPEMLVLGDRTAVVERFPALADAFAATGTAALAVLPVGDPSDRSGGSVCLFWTSPRSFDGGSRDELRSMVDIIGQTVGRVDLVAAEHQLAVALQERILRPLPVIPGLELAARYVPASRNMNLGGDWYDVVVRGSQVFLIVGDLVGHGLEAITRMTELRAIVNGLVHADTPLAELPAAVAAMNDTEDPSYGSLQVLRIEVEERTLELVSAGHPPAVLVSGGAARLLTGGRAAFLGVPVQPVVTATVDLAPGSLIVAYTDGLVERRGQALDDAFADLLVAVDALAPDAPVTVVADRLLALAAAPDHTIDDLVVLAARIA